MAAILPSASGTSTAAATSAPSSTATPRAINDPYISINKQAGILSVYAAHSDQKRIKEYIDKVRKSISAQVLIEAKVVEITLNDSYQTGINWAELDKKIQSGLGLAMVGNFTSGMAGAADTLSLGVFNKFVPSELLNPASASTDTSSTATTTTSNGSNSPNYTNPLSGSSLTNNLQTLVQLTQQFGTTRTLSSPRINAMNNQQAVLSFVTNQVYFSVNVTAASTSSTSTTTTTNPLTVNSTMNTIPIGVILTLQPSINLDTDEITMNIRPTITRSDSSVSDPAVNYLVNTSGESGGTLSSAVPVVQVKELDSIVKIKSGQIMVIGGMMEETSVNKDSGVPYVMSLPFIGHLFKSVSKKNTVVQTVIFIKATIVPSDNNASKHDQMIYNKFGRDHEA